MPELMTTQEVAEYLRIKERKVYDLVRQKAIPCTRVTGKWLFPRHLIDLWVAEHAETAGAAERVETPMVVAGSHDPLLEWALRESGSNLALLAGGSLDGLRRIVAGEAMVAGMHVFEGDDRFNEGTVAAACANAGMVLIEWARRRQGLVVAAGNPLAIGTISDLAGKKARVVLRQAEAGSRILFEHLLANAGIAMDALQALEEPALTETDLALAVQAGRADAGLAVETVAHQHGLAFVSLFEERYDLLMRRRDHFEPPVQTLLAFSRTEAFRARAGEMAGYDVSGLGRAVWNG